MALARHSSARGLRCSLGCCLCAGPAGGRGLALAEGQTVSPARSPGRNSPGSSRRLSRRSALAWQGDSWDDWAGSWAAPRPAAGGGWFLWPSWPAASAELTRGMSPRWPPDHRVPRAARGAPPRGPWAGLCPPPGVTPGTMGGRGDAGARGGLGWAPNAFWARLGQRWARGPCQPRCRSPGRSLGATVPWQGDPCGPAASAQPGLSQRCRTKRRRVVSKRV